jgi:hypothetical protein
MFCPRCGSDRLRRSHTHGLKEKIAKRFSFKAFRCRESECAWRGLIRIKASDQITIGYLAKFRVPLILMGVILFSLTIFFFFIYFD